MIYQSSLKEQLENIMIVTLSYLKEDHSNIHNLETLKNYYNKYISDLYNIEIDCTKTKFTINPEESKKLLNIFNGINTSSLDDKNQKFTISDKIETNNLNDQLIRINDSLNELSLHSNEHYHLFNNMITDVFILPSLEARGGSSSTALGIIWANPRLTHTINDITEFLIHELTHNSLFIDERRFGHYCYDSILDESTWANSAILKIPRPIDKVIHSIIVSLEIILYRDIAIGHPPKPKLHPPTEVMLKQIDDSIFSVESVLLQNKKEILKERTLNLLENVKNMKNSLV
ncbi:hypothetical protein EC844_14410 [Acinetobacter calcoaceticus]|uniref:HEXXH motif domain protein n=1 Tax=Acinetobacter calcoaceticus TaxID=471 RepID=A0A4V2QZ46_ACICA|nr:hypothetical protein EC844_14410 [Acinetobacter calcoaceticus]